MPNTDKIGKYRNSGSGGALEKLVEYRETYYSSSSEASRYITNTPAQVYFRFENPIICELKSGSKIMRIDGGAPFRFFPGDVMYVPPGARIEIDLSAAKTTSPCECDCVEIEAERFDHLIARMNHSLSRTNQDTAVAMDWSAYAVFRGAAARDFGMSGLMQMYRCPSDMFRDIRIDMRIDDILLRLLQSRSRDLLCRMTSDQDGGLSAAARLIREHLDRHVSTAELAAVASMSETSLYRHFRHHFGTTPARFANQLRIREAKRLLQESNDTVESLAFRLGFSDASHFSRVFRRSTGGSPAEFRRTRQGLARLVG